MALPELKEAIRLKTIEYEMARRTGLLHDHLLKLYKELKDLQYPKLQAELRPEQAAR
jgi:hypothetical protein